MTRVVVGVLLLLGLVGRASGQTTRPAEKAADAWPRAVEALSRALVEGNLGAVEGLLSARASCRRFDSVNPEDPARMVERLVKSTLVGQHAYLHPPLVMAADIAADFKNAAAVGDKAKARYIVDDENEMKRANATAVQWVVEQLEAKAGTPVGVIILWTPRPAAPGAPQGTAVVSEPLFVLCRGEEVAAGEYRVNAIVFGNPIPASQR